jgi:hypothetical protein
LQKWRSRATGAMHEKEDGGGGVGWTVTLPLSFIPALEIYVRSQPSTTKWKQPS